MVIEVVVYKVQRCGTPCPIILKLQKSFGMEKPVIPKFAQFRDFNHRMTDLVYVIDVNDIWSFLLGRCRLMYILFIIYK